MEEQAEPFTSPKLEDPREIFNEEFALSLGHTGIELLDVSKGLKPLAQVELDSAYLRQELIRARKMITDGRDITKPVAVLIPSEQIYVREVEIVTEDQAEAEKHVKSALDGATPYKLEEIELDIRWQPNNPTVRFAAVAKETLREAYTFCTEHKFQPSSFRTLPLGDSFPFHAVFKYENQKTMMTFRNPTGR